jgi:hypothetical protein
MKYEKPKSQRTYHLIGYERKKKKEELANMFMADWPISAF